MRHACSRLRRGFSLLEVILALMILGMALASLGELARLGLRNGVVACDRNQAALLCESRMAEILAAGTIPDAVEGEELDNPTDPTGPTWLCSVTVESTDQDSLMAVRVTVIQDLPAEKRPVQFSLVRWMLDTTNLTTTADTESSSSSSSSSTNSANSTNSTNQGS